MPNWCHNTLEVSGDETEVFDWVRRVREPGEGENEDGTPLFFSSLVPEPQYKQDENKQGLPDWYSWRVTNWGTKWEPSFSHTPVYLTGEHPDLHRTEGRAVYTFDTAWGPPLEWLERAAEIFPSLRLTLVYGEPGMDFGGRVSVRGEEVLVIEEGSAEDYLDAEMLWF
jgi:hypothetical protein